MKNRKYKGPERRKHPRVKTNNLVSYVCRDDSDNQIKEGMGRAVNISQGGILIETHNSLEWQDILLLAIDVEDELISVKGQVVYCNAADSGMFRAGIQFLETNEKILSFVINLLKTYL
jgi:c-di-GMP-binding flagellar brake protein YcgR